MTVERPTTSSCAPWDVVRAEWGDVMESQRRQFTRKPCTVCQEPTRATTGVCWRHTYCPHAYVLPSADHPAAGLERCPEGCTDELFHDPDEWEREDAEQRAVFGF